MQSRHLRASEDGFLKIRQALEETQLDTGWAIDSDEWRKYGAKLYDSSWTEDDKYPKGFSLPTWIRFASGDKGKPIAINAKAFRCFCRVLGLSWEDVVEEKSIENITNKQHPNQADIQTTFNTGLLIPSSRCRTIWGRDELIKSILKILNNPQELSMLCLWGGAGYGKTELAAQISREALSQGGFDDVLWITARASELLENKIIEIKSQNYTLYMFLNELAEQLKCSVQKIKFQIKSHKFLIVIDNAETSNLEEIIAYLADCLNYSRVIITSRVRTKPPYVKVIKTKGLDKESADKLLSEEAELNEIESILSATKEQLNEIYNLSCGAPLALHFIVGRAYHDQLLEPVLSELRQAEQQVEIFYKYCLETAWLRIDKNAQSILRHIGHITDAGITLSELSMSLNLSSLCINQNLSQLRRWYLIEEGKDKTGVLRIDLHPWVRTSIRQKIVDKWQPSSDELKQLVGLKKEQLTWNPHTDKTGI